jgi:Zn-dependent M28 family amino/carboxypeptidase
MTSELAVPSGDALGTKITGWVQQLGSVIGERNDRDAERYARLGRTRDLIISELAASGAPPRVLPYQVGALSYENVELELPGANPTAPIVVVGAHYDTARKAPGANDNGTGVACLLALARLLPAAALGCSVRLVAFANEEPPHTRKPSMGSLVYARELARQRIPVRGMISLESLAPVRTPLLPRAPLFVVGNLQSRRLASQLHTSLGDGPRFASRRVIAPGFLPGIRSSDHWSFWKHGWSAVMLTAGGPLTYRHYHRPTDTVAHTRLDHLLDVARACSSSIASLLAT